MKDTEENRPPWSRRTQWNVEETPWAQHLARLRAAGVPLFDLTISNPTQCGFYYDAAAILAPLSDPGTLLYDPNPKGMLAAREAVSVYYRAHAALVNPEHIFLTASTSEAYSYLFRLLCDPGDEVLIARPGYPLFDFLATLDDVRLEPYELFYDYGWHLDTESLRRRITHRTRAIVVVHPNNPTGHFTSRGDRAAIEELCREHRLALIVDEVFLDYGLSTQGESFANGDHPVNTFLLSGLSKVAALPQMKAAWIACFAPPEALQRLEIIADTFLSVSAPVQFALPAWLQQRKAQQSQIVQRVAANLATLDRILSGQASITRLTADAGWYAVLRVPHLQNQEETALALLLQRHVMVHSGDSFGFDGQGWLVVSLLGREDECSRGLAALCEHFA